MKTIGKEVVLIMLFLSLLTSCSRDNARTGTGEYRIDSVKIYQETPVWELAQAVKSQDTKRIESITKKSPELLNYQDTLYETTLLHWAIGTERYKSAEALLKAGADPDIISKYDGGTALYRAAGFSWVDSSAKKDAKYVRLLLEYGADPNIGFVGNDHNNSTEIGETPLMRSIGCGIEKAKALVEAGADINIQTPAKRTAAIIALGGGGYTTHVDAAQYAYYLIVGKKAKVNDSYGRTRVYQGDDPNTEFYPVDGLRYWVFDLDSDGYKLKMEIVDEFTRQGVDYWSTEIPKYTLEHIQKLYPDTWEEYIQKY